MDKNLWLTFAAFAFLTGSTVWLIEAIDQKSENLPSRRVGMIFWLVLLAIFFAQSCCSLYLRYCCYLNECSFIKISVCFYLVFVGEKLSNNLSRFVMFVWLIVVLVLITGYTATLTSLLTVEQFELESKGGTVGFHGGSFFGGVTISNLKFIDNKETPYYSYEDYANALSKGGKHGGADAIADEVPYIKMFLARYTEQDYVMVSSQPVAFGFGFVSKFTLYAAFNGKMSKPAKLPLVSKQMSVVYTYHCQIFAKVSPLVADMSREIDKLRENGTRINLEKKWFVNETSLLNQDSFTKTKTLNLNIFGGLFIVIGISLALAL